MDIDTSLVALPLELIRVSLSLPLWAYWYRNYKYCHYQLYGYYQKLSVDRFKTTISRTFRIWLPPEGARLMTLGENEFLDCGQYARNPV